MARVTDDNISTARSAAVLRSKAKRLGIDLKGRNLRFMAQKQQLVNEILSAMQKPKDTLDPQEIAVKEDIEEAQENYQEPEQPEVVEGNLGINTEAAEDEALETALEDIEEGKGLTEEDMTALEDVDYPGENVEDKELAEALDSDQLTADEILEATNGYGDEDSDLTDFDPNEEETVYPNDEFPTVEDLEEADQEQADEVDLTVDEDLETEIVTDPTDEPFGVEVLEE